ncbi:Asp-tRNA(Asn)/Glu-tRNA(Gln) amidotransferase subunit GatB [Caldisericum exile]|uniref:Aspartyl/glutamyl-tRNA(Asn/Gln) amidotransferase subunit B n=1 Tax=Caldisericum exile (strain DSM 21853 / NBRC 104410 / AZM16c01) TaxID=511051 RepID=A0A7U6GE66_CALEA|nr:Asp-tRNA(Asn)/Glu-tRNA(Gln) amidotransferase subunit GatB [Caldisericum exile]BAL80754.1 aspartyl/glutamyl-tRNA(Asn/Gln) amidotransferase subunit B [Caldisericum exile AZM16c01]
MYKPTIGLEIHIQLATKSKMFCSCSTEFGDPPNTHVCPVCLGLPGALPVINKEAVKYGIKLAHALNMEINLTSTFYRKNYFYPDLPKGYQITQYSLPLGFNGFLEIPMEGKIKTIRIERGHIEEDSGKSIHIGDITESEYSFIDFNRSGVPLMEIVTYPDFESGDEAYEFLTLLRSIVRYLGVSSGDMEKGALRCDVNVSVSKNENKGTKVEIKNLNSFRSVKRAIDYEVERQINAIERGERIIRETRHFDEKEGTTKPMRVKEELNDYRYFPEPDLPPLVLDEEFVSEIKREIPELPHKKAIRYIETLGIQEDYARTIAYNKKYADYFENIVDNVGHPIEVANFFLVNILGLLNKRGKDIDSLTFGTNEFKELFHYLDSGLISTNIAKGVIEESIEKGLSVKEIVESKGLIQITDENQIRNVVIEVLKKNPTPVSQYLSGKKQVFGFLVGQTMKELKGKGKPELVNKILNEELSKLGQGDQL